MPYGPAPNDKPADPGAPFPASPRNLQSRVTGWPIDSGRSNWTHISADNVSNAAMWAGAWGPSPTGRRQFVTPVPPSTLLSKSGS